MPEPRLIPVDYDPWQSEAAYSRDSLSKSVDIIFGLNGQERYQLWPEKMVRSAITLPNDMLTGKVLDMTGLRREDFTDIPKPEGSPIKTRAGGSVSKSMTPISWEPTDEMIERTQDVAGLAGTGGLAGVGKEAGVALGSTPFLRPALKYEGKIYKAPKDGQHLDAIPENLRTEFQRQAMSGEDISNFNFGFMNHKGQFLNREKALEYGIKEGLIDPHAGQYNVLTTSLMADSSKPGVAIEALAKSQKAPAFYSAVEHAVENIKQEKMPADQWLGTIQNSRGVKPEELEWTGLKDFLAEKKGPITKQEVKDFIAENKIELKEIVKEIKPELEAKGKALAESHGNNWNELSVADRGRYIRIADGRRIVDYGGDPKFDRHDLKLPGGENYREILLTLPAKEKTKDWKVRNNPEVEGEFEVLDHTGRVRYGTTELEDAQKYIKDQNQIDAKSNAYKSSHWDEPNVLAHVRVNDRTIDGKKSIHLEEIQSDWHQMGRDKGYKINEKELEKKIDANRAELKKNFPELNEMDAGSWDKAWKANPDLKTIEDRLIFSVGYVPDAPFKKNWHELALKKMIREAAEKGYERLSWTPGEAQAARYDLSKQINELKISREKDWDKTEPILRSTNKYEMTGVDKNGKTFELNAKSDEHLAEVIGKEMAKKIIDNKENHQKYSGLDLKVGGEGMKGFYDQIIPKALEKIGKEYGVNVQKGNLKSNIKWDYKKNNLGHFDVYKNGELEKHSLRNEQSAKNFIDRNKGEDAVFYIDIPQGLKDTALRKGFPLFSSGLPLIPVDRDPFKDSVGK